MSTEVRRDESFRTALKNQKRRLSATIMPGRKPSLPEVVPPKPLVQLKTKPTSIFRKMSETLLPKKKGIETTAKIITQQTREKSCTPDIKFEFWDIDELSPLSTPASSPIPRSPSPFDFPGPPSPRLTPSPHLGRSPVPPDSPLLKPHLNAESPALKRARSFNKELRKARSFRMARDKSTSRNSSAVNSRNVSPEPENVTNGNIEQTESSFSIKRALGSRRGWKIMADDGGMVDGVALRRVVTIIKDMELQGFAVPERITIKVP